MIPFSLSVKSHRLVGQLDRLLHAAYGAPEHLLENKKDPLDEAVYIILSFQTDLDRLKVVWRRLRTAYPSWTTLVDAPDEEVADVIRPGGLYTQRTRTIKRLLRAVRTERGSYSLDNLEHMTTAKAHRFLTRLPGLSWKGARCVLLYSLGRRVFPIDVNTFRIFKRVGILPSDAVYRRRSLHEVVQDAVHPSCRRRFHVNLVVHGRTICRPRPVCESCPVQAICMEDKTRMEQRVPVSCRSVATSDVAPREVGHAQ